MSDKTKPIVVFKNVTKKYKLYRSPRQRFMNLFFKNHFKPKVIKAINKVSFTVERGETIAFLGRNGAGKSTILKMLTGVCFPTSGDIKVRGVVSALLELKSGFDPEFTGRENIYLKCQIMGMPDEKIREKEADIVEFADIGEYMEQPVRTYSSGMKARLGFAIAVNVDPEVLIIDEALSVGDRQFREKCLDRVNEIINRDDVTLLFVTHSLGTARQFCKRGIYLKKGKIMFDGEIDSAIKMYEETYLNKKKANEQEIKNRISAMSKESVLDEDV